MYRASWLWGMTATQDHFLQISKSGYDSHGWTSGAELLVECDES